MKDSDEFVKYLVRMFGIKDGVEYEKILPFHKCTETDWAQFAPPQKGSRDGWETIKDDPKRGMYCLDWKEEPVNGINGLSVFGNEKNGNYQRIEIVLLPCNYLHTSLGGGTVDIVSKNCNADLDAQIEYLGPLEIVLYHTQERFNQRVYGEESLELESILLN